MLKIADVNLKDVIAGLIVLSILVGFGIEGFAADNYKDMVIAQNDDDGHPGKGNRHGPPPEAVEACQAQSVGDTCAFISSEGDSFEGICEIMRGDVIACLPDNRPPHGKGKPGGPPPDEGY
ncbi:MAG: hypothetical protein WBB48_07765 [Thermodesulfobacteriota bacterium]